MNVEQTVAIAKAGKLSRSELYKRMESIAAERREPGQSTAQAFAKFINTEEGAELFRIQHSLPGRDTEPVWQAPVTKAAGADDWTNLVAVTKRAAGCSEAEAIRAALSTEAGRYAFAKTKRAQQIATGAFTVADMECLDGVAREQDQYQDLHKRAPKSDFEGMVDGVMQARPGLSWSQAASHVMSTHDGQEAWKDYKKLGGTGRRLPQAHVPQPGEEEPEEATSGRGQPSRKPQWRSDHSGSSPTTPARTPERLMENPTLKQWNSLVMDIQETLGVPRVEAVAAIKKTADGLRFFNLAAAEYRRCAT
jgi:hypothetical protein